MIPIFFIFLNRVLLWMPSSRAAARSSGLMVKMLMAPVLAPHTAMCMKPSVPLRLLRILMSLAVSISAWRSRGISSP